MNIRHCGAYQCIIISVRCATAKISNPKSEVIYRKMISHCWLYRTNTTRRDRSSGHTRRLYVVNSTFTLEHESINNDRSMPIVSCACEGKVIYGLRTRTWRRLHDGVSRHPIINKCPFNRQWPERRRNFNDICALVETNRLIVPVYGSYVIGKFGIRYLPFCGGQVMLASDTQIT